MASMHESASPTFRACAAALTGDQGHRVWSLIVTIFGDLAQGKGDAISGPLLSQLTGLMGVRPEAMRVALHRLRKDGWIESLREGRASTHFLTGYGRAQSAAASPRIYGTGVPSPDLWHLLIAGDTVGAARLEAFLQSDDYIALGGQAALAPGPLPDDHGGLLGVETGAVAVPDWLRAQICPEPLMRAYSECLAAFENVLDCLDRSPPLTGAEAAALRGLVVHSWRRILLRHPDLPPAFFPEGWPGVAARERFSRIMAALPVPDLAVLEQGLTGHDSRRAVLEG